MGYTVNNHDVRRFLSLEGGPLEGAMLHTAFTITMRGTPLSGNVPALNSSTARRGGLRRSPRSSSRI